MRTRHRLGVLWVALVSRAAALLVAVIGRGARSARSASPRNAAALPGGAVDVCHGLFLMEH